MSSFSVVAGAVSLFAAILDWKISLNRREQKGSNQADEAFRYPVSASIVEMRYLHVARDSGAVSVPNGALVNPVRVGG